MTSSEKTVRSFPFSEPVALDVDPLYAHLVREEPVSRIMLPYGGEAWLVTRYADVKTVLGDPRFSRAATVGADMPRMRPEIDNQASSILNMDPPHHTRLRRLVAKAFTARRVEELRPKAARLTAQLLADMRAEGTGADLVEHLSVPLPVTIICELMGVPTQDRTIFRAGADAFVTSTSQTPEQRATAKGELFAYMAGLVAQRRVTPTDDLLGALVIARDEGDRLTEEELVALGIGTLVAGHETTMNQIGNMTYLLLTQPGHTDRLRTSIAGEGADSGEAIGRAIEELLRYTQLSAGGDFLRIATEDVELSGVTIRAGESVLAPTHAANRDPEQFADPGELDLERTENRHVAFGFGPHHCFGAQLARMELQEAIGGLLREFPALRLAVAPGDVVWRTGALVRGPQRLPLAW
ncbi:cytochrome P450 [Amycolatopsis japonica]|uniref:cytochrome P450 n=1 Tax=Amycolatopsis japonica TaxID=208439 RepID=UPI00366D2894